MPRARAVGALAIALFLPTTVQAEELSFSRALKIARTRAPEMKLAKAKVSTGEAGVDTARAPYYPTLGATGTATEIASGERDGVFPPRTQPTNLVTYTTGMIAAASLRWTLYDFGRTGNNVDAAEATFSSDKADAANTEAQLLGTVANAYLDVVYDEKIRDIDKAIVDDREKSTTVVKGLVKQGLSPAVEELRAHSRVEAARRDLETAEATLAQARVSLLAFLGLDPKAATAFAVPRLPRQRLDADGAMKEAEDRQPAVITAKAAAHSEVFQVDAARARYYPSLQLQGDASYRYANVDIFNQWLPTRTATGSLVLSIPVFDASIPANLAAAKADQARANATFDQTKRDARTEAVGATVALSTNERVLEHARKAAEASTAVLAVIRARFLQGLSSMLDIIEAETSDASARIAAVQAERALDGAVVRVLVATGHTARLYDVP